MPQVDTDNRMNRLVGYFSEITGRFSNPNHEKLSDSIPAILNRTGQLAGVDLINVLILKADNPVPQTIFNSNRGRKRGKNSKGEISWLYPWLIQRTKIHKNLRVNDVRKSFDKQIPLKELAINSGFRSIFSVRSKLSNDSSYIISFITTEEVHIWSDHEIQILRLMSGFLSSFFSRLTMEEENRKNALRFQTLYDQSPIAIWEEDFSEVKRYIYRKKFLSTQKCRDYFYSHQDTVIRLMSSIKILDVNDITLKMWNHTDKSSLLGGLGLSNIQENIHKYIEELVAISEDRLFHKIENLIITGATGKDNYVNLYWNVMPGHEKDWSRVLVSAVDNTGQINTEKSLRASEERLRMLVDNAEDMIFLQESSGKLLFFNSPPIYEINEAAIMGKSPRDALPEEYANSIENAFITVMKSQKPFHYETPVPSSRGQMWISFLAYPVTDQQKKIHAVGTIGRNITRQKEAELSLAEAQKALSARVIELERRNFEISMQSEMLTMMQFSQEIDETYKMVGQVLRQLFPGLNGSLLALNSSRNELSEHYSWGIDGLSRSSFQAEACWALRSGKPFLNVDTNQGFVCQHIPQPLPHSTYCVPFMIDNVPAGCLSIWPNLPNGSIQETEIRLANSTCEQIGLAFTNIKLRQGLREQAIRDGLTGLYNRLYLDESITRELYRQERNGQALSVIMMDLDHLKEINDIYGHAAGDSVLRALGHLLKQSVRASDLPCRYGGDEFVLVMPETSLEIARRRAEKIADLFRKLSIPFGAQTLGGYTLSIGIATAPQHGHTSQDLLSSVDTALYQAKRAGRDRIVNASSEIDE